MPYNGALCPNGGSDVIWIQQVVRTKLETCGVVLDLLYVLLQQTDVPGNNNSSSKPGVSTKQNAKCNISWDLRHIIISQFDAETPVYHLMYQK